MTFFHRPSTTALTILSFLSAVEVAAVSATLVLPVRLSSIGATVARSSLSRPSIVDSRPDSLAARDELARGVIEGDGENSDGVRVSGTSNVECMPKKAVMKLYSD